MSPSPDRTRSTPPPRTAHTTPASPPSPHECCREITPRTPLAERCPPPPTVCRSHDSPSDDRRPPEHRGQTGEAAPHRIPEQISGDKDIGVGLEEGVEAPFDGDDPFELEGVVGHRFSIAVGIDHFGRIELDCHRGCFLQFLHTVPSSADETEGLSRRFPHHVLECGCLCDCY